MTNLQWKGDVDLMQSIALGNLDESKILATARWFNNVILGNADGISAFLKDIEENYGVSIYSSVVDPWNDGADALAKYLEMLKASCRQGT